MDCTGILEWNFNPFCYNSYCNVCDYNATIFLLCMQIRCLATTRKLQERITRVVQTNWKSVVCAQVLGKLWFHLRFWYLKISGIEVAPLEVNAVWMLADSWLVLQTLSSVLSSVLYSASSAGDLGKVHTFILKVPTLIFRLKHMPIPSTHPQILKYYLWHS